MSREQQRASPARTRAIVAAGSGPGLRSPGGPAVRAHRVPSAVAPPFPEATDVLSGKQPGTAPRALFAARVCSNMSCARDDHDSDPRTCSSAGARHDRDHHLARTVDKLFARAWPVEVLVLDPAVAPHLPDTCVHEDY